MEARHATLTLERFPNKAGGFVVVRYVEFVSQVRYLPENEFGLLVVVIVADHQIAHADLGDVLRDRDVVFLIAVADRRIAASDQSSEEVEGFHAATPLVAA